jgi:AraC-like DNA-binding protein
MRSSRERDGFVEAAPRMNERLFVRLEDDPLYAPETTVPRGTMRECLLPSALRDLVAHVIAYDEALPHGQEVNERVLPDGALRLIFDLHDPPRAAHVAGPNAKPIVLTFRGRVHGLSVTLRPGAALALLGVPAHELADRDVSWADIATPEQRDLVPRLLEAQGDAARARMLASVLQASRRDLDLTERRTALRAAALFRSGERSVRAVAAAVGLGERRLQQVFRAHIGLPPRTWRRLARMHECLRLLRGPAALPWHALALDGGFCDQSHLINEFRSLCGLTPEQFLQRGVSGSSKTAA